MNGRGGQARFLELAGETHDFDAPYHVTRSPNAQNPAHCVSFIGPHGRQWEENGEAFPNTAEGWRAFERACLEAGASTILTAGNTGNPRTGYREWLAFFIERLR